MVQCQLLKKTNYISNFMTNSSEQFHVSCIITSNFEKYSTKYLYINLHVEFMVMFFSLSCIKTQLTVQQEVLKLYMSALIYLQLDLRYLRLDSGSTGQSSDAHHLCKVIRK